VILLLALCAVTSLPPEPVREVWRQTTIRGFQGGPWPGHEYLILDAALPWPADGATEPPVGQVTRIEPVDPPPFVACDYGDGTVGLNLQDPGWLTLP
jgi:hypothetical protein